MDISQPLPWALTLDSGRSIELYAAFDRILALLDVLKRQDMTEWDRDAAALFLLFGEQRMDQQEAREAVRKAQDILFEQHPAEHGPRVLDFHQDAALIISAFQQAYGVDLYQEQGRLHWLRFLALLNGLPQSTRLSEVMEIRACPIPKANKHNREEVHAIMRAKAKYGLKLTSEESTAQFNAGLQGLAKFMMQQAGE